MNFWKTSKRPLTPHPIFGKLCCAFSGGPKICNEIHSDWCDPPPFFRKFIVFTPPKLPKVFRKFIQIRPSGCPLEASISWEKNCVPFNTDVHMCMWVDILPFRQINCVVVKVTKWRNAQFAASTFISFHSLLLAWNNPADQSESMLWKEGF